MSHVPEKQEGDDAHVAAIGDDPDRDVLARPVEGARPHADHEDEHVVRPADAHRRVAVALGRLRALR